MTDNTITVSGTDFEYAFDRQRGTLASMRVDGTELLSRGPLLNAWRTPISNENVGWGTAEVEEWRAAGLDRLEHEVENVTVESVTESVTRVQVTTVASAPDEPAAFEVEYLYHVFGTGDVLVGVRAAPNDALASAISTWLPRVGLQLELVDDLREFSWYGHGPHETYPDRKAGTPIDVYEGSVEEQYTPYVRPQDYGNKTDVRWATLEGDDVGLAAFGHPTLNVSAHHISPENLDRARYTYQVRDGDGITLNLDHAVTGVGGTPVQTLPEYRVVPDGPFEFVVGLRPLNGSASPMALSRRRLPFAFASTDPYGRLSLDYDESDGTVRVSAIVRNATGNEKEFEVPLVVNGNTVKTTDVSLAPGAKTDVRFDYRVGDSGFFEIAIGDLEPVSLTLPELSLAGEWRFREGDAAEWKRPDYDDRSWNVVTLPANWEDTSDYTDNQVFGWYRKTFTVPAEWAGHDLELPLGKIDDVDESFFNGTKIGQTGTFPENEYETAWGETRRYTVPTEAVNFGGENVVAIRVYDGGGGGGLYDGPLGPVAVK